MGGRDAGHAEGHDESKAAGTKLLREADQLVGRFLDRFRPEQMGADQIEEVLALSTTLCNRLTAVRAQAGARLASFGNWTKEGERSAAHQLAQRTGTSVSEAEGTLRSGALLTKLPAVARAATAGLLSRNQLEAVADASSVNPRAQERLLRVAQVSSLPILREECARAKAQVQDAEERRQKVHKERYLRTFNDADGGWNLRVRTTPDQGATIMVAINEIADRRFERSTCSPSSNGRNGHASGTADCTASDTIDACRVDALVELARSNGSKVASGSTTRGGGGRHKVIFRVDWEAFRRGRTHGSEAMEISGFGQVPASVVAAVLAEEDPFVAAVVTNAQEITHVAHLGRRPNALQQTALEWLYPTCAAANCVSSTYLEFDHRLEWSRDKQTALSNIDRLCSHHHALKTKSGWALVEGTGKRAFVPPDDPRHPASSKRAATSNGGSRGGSIDRTRPG